MAATRMISIIGRKNAGKTTLLVALAAELARRKFRVMTIKHGTHPADMDQRGKDTWRHWHEGKAERVLMEAPGERVLFERTPQESDPVTLARRYLDGADIVVVRGSNARRYRRSKCIGSSRGRTRSSIRRPTTRGIGWRWSRTTRGTARSSPCFVSRTPRGS